MSRRKRRNNMPICAYLWDYPKQNNFLYFRYFCGT